MHLIDIGANLTHESFRRDFDAVLDRARRAGVERMIVTGASREGSEHALALAHGHPEMLHATAGVHPHHAGDYGAETDALLRTLAREPEVVAIGETGLDYARRSRNNSRSRWSSACRCSCTSAMRTMISSRC